jgi:long-chain-fatty-acid--CoA ligase ACSBG
MFNLGSLNTTIKDARPTFFFGVPRVWEKMQEAIEKKTKNLSGTKLKLFNWSREQATLQITSNFYGQRKSSLSYSIAKKLVINNIHKELGLDRCRFAYSGAAPITKETLDFFVSLGIPLCEVYGMRFNFTLIKISHNNFIFFDIKIVKQLDHIL